MASAFWVCAEDVWFGELRLGTHRARLGYDRDEPLLEQPEKDFGKNFVEF